jgi:hypothetical protein
MFLHSCVAEDSAAGSGLYQKRAGWAWSAPTTQQVAPATRPPSPCACGPDQLHVTILAGLEAGCCGWRGVLHWCGWRGWRGAPACWSAWRCASRLFPSRNCRCCSCSSRDLAAGSCAAEERQEGKPGVPVSLVSQCYSTSGAPFPLPALSWLPGRLQATLALKCNCPVHNRTHLVQLQRTEPTAAGSWQSFFGALAACCWYEGAVSVR